MRKGGWTYIITNKPRGVLYVGVTAEIAARIFQHRNGSGSDFCRRYNLDRLVLAEEHQPLKAWNREWKIRLIEESNPDWLDLAVDLVAIR